MQFGKLSLKRCRYGWMLYSGPYIGKCFDLYGEYSEPEASLLRALVRPGDTAIDVGAYIGDLTIPLSLAVGEQGRVYAIESQSISFNVLCANLALNGITNTKPINAYVTSAGNSDGALPGFLDKKWPAPPLSIDALDISSCRLLKIDVDGGEIEVLRSAEMMIERFRPFLYFENDVREKSRELLSFAMETLGYRLHWHITPIFRPDNFFGNPVNHWAPDDILSIMVLGFPKEDPVASIDLPLITSPDDWHGLLPQARR